MTNSLRDEIDDILYDAHTECWCAVTDRIMALLSKIPELYWSEQVNYEKGMRYLMWGGARLGYCYNSGRAWWTYVAVIPNSMVGGPFQSEKAAHDAVESAVRKALGFRCGV